MIQKYILNAFATLTSASSLFAADDFIRQIDFETNTTRDSYVEGPDSIGEKGGQIAGAMPVGAAGASFELFGVGLAPDNTLYSLDKSLTGVDIPSGLIEVDSGDPYDVITRTRADKPFKAKLTFSNIQTDDASPQSSKYLYIERLVVEYPEETDRLPIANDNEENLRVVEAFFVNNNGSTDWTDIETSLRHEEAYKQKGEERIRIYALPNEDLGWSILEEKKIHIWPISDAEIKASTTGSSDDAFTLSEGQVLNSAPTIFISAQDLYPSSKTTVRLYKGVKRDGTLADFKELEIKNLGSYAIESGENAGAGYAADEFHTVTPQSINKVFSSAEIEDFANEDGVYTVDIISQTPFEEFYRYSWATFEIKTGVKVRASIGTAE